MDPQQRKLLKVASASREPTFSSFSAATRASSQTDRAARAREDSERLKGCTLLGYRCTFDRVELQWSEGFRLVVSDGGGEVRWELIEGAAELDPGGNVRVIRECEPSGVLLDLEGLSGTHAWDRRALLEARCDRRISVLSASFDWLFLYVEGCEGLMFSRFVEVESGRRLIYFGEE